MSKTKKILITGATGFIGQHLLDDLVGMDYSIRIISRQQKPELRNTVSQIEIIQGDICDRETICRAFDGIDVVINLAAELRDISQLSSSNEDAIRLMVEEGLKSNVKRFIHLSSVGVTGAQYSGVPLVITEETICHPQNPYEVSKNRSEEILRDSFWNKNNQLIILRPTNVYGDFHPREALLNLFRHVKNGAAVYASLSSCVNYLYVKDLTSVIIHAIDQEMKYNCYQVGHSMKFADFINAVAKAENVKPKLRTISLLSLRLSSALTFIAPSLRTRLRSLSNAVIYSDEKLMKEFQYPFGYERGLVETVNYYQKKGKLE